MSTVPDGKFAYKLAVDACAGVEPRFHDDKERSAGKGAVALDLGATVYSGDAVVRIGSERLKQFTYCPLGIPIQMDREA